MDLAKVAEGTKPTAVRVPWVLRREVRCGQEPSV